MMSFVRQLFTGRDNQTVDIARVVGFEVIHFYIFISIYAIYKGGSFDPLTWGAGAASIMASIGAWIGLKAGTEPIPSSLSVTTKDGVSFSQSFGNRGSSSDGDLPSIPAMPPGTIMQQPPAELPGDTK